MQDRLEDRSLPHEAEIVRVRTVRRALGIVSEESVAKDVMEPSAACFWAGNKMHVKSQSTRMASCFSTIIIIQILAQVLFGGG